MAHRLSPLPTASTPALDVRGLAPRLRRAKILGTFEALAPGTAFILISEHDPKPLYDQLEAEWPGTFAWRELVKGPEVWRVEIRKTATPIVSAPPTPAASPPTLAAVELRQVHLDVRDQIRRGEEPFGRIMAAVTALREGEALVLRAPFEPRPLYRALGARGLAHWNACHAPEDWVIWFYREPDAAPPPFPETCPAGDAATLRVDVRGLEPPEPMGPRARPALRIKARLQEVVASLFVLSFAYVAVAVLCAAAPRLRPE